MTKTIPRIVLNTAEMNALLAIAPVGADDGPEKTRQALVIANTGGGAIAVGIASAIQKGLLREKAFGGYEPAGDMTQYAPALWNPQETLMFIFRGSTKYSTGAVLASPEGCPLLVFSLGSGHYSISPAVHAGSGELFETYSHLASVLLHEFTEEKTSNPLACSISLNLPHRRVIINALAEKSMTGQWDVAVEDATPDSPASMKVVDIRSLRDFTSLVSSTGPLVGHPIVRV